MKLEFIQPLLIEPAGKELWELISDYGVKADGEAYFVPKGFRFDGASIPRFLWRLCGHPLTQPRVYAACLHDYLYNLGGNSSDRKIADSLYRDMLKALGISAFVAGVEYYAVRWFGGSHFGDGEED